MNPFDQDQTQQLAKFTITVDMPSHWSPARQQRVLDAVEEQMDKATQFLTDQLWLLDEGLVITLDGETAINTDSQFFAIASGRQQKQQLSFRDFFWTYLPRALLTAVAGVLLALLVVALTR